MNRLQDQYFFVNAAVPSWNSSQELSRAAFQILRSDVVRKELAGVTSLPNVFEEGLYTAGWTERTYAECLRRAKELVFEGKRVLVDASFRQEKGRRAGTEDVAGIAGGVLFLAGCLVFIAPLLGK